MTRLTRDEILAATDLPREEVEVPEWGGSVLVRGLTAKERVDLASRMVTTEGEIDNQQAIELQTLIPALCMIDDDGQRLFSDGDVALLGEKSSQALNRVFEVAQKLSALTPAASKAAEKNFASLKGVLPSG